MIADEWVEQIKYIRSERPRDTFSTASGVTITIFVMESGDLQIERECQNLEETSYIPYDAVCRFIEGVSKLYGYEEKK